MTPDRCGRCDHHRHVELPDGRIARCPRCHPLARQIQPARCPDHPTEPIAACSPCAADQIAAPDRPTPRPALTVIDGGRAA